MRHAIVTSETVAESDNLAAEVVLDLFGVDGPPPATVADLLEFLERELVEANKLAVCSGVRWRSAEALRGFYDNVTAALRRMQAKDDETA